ncbi:c-type cytochrome [Salinarimonas ramus]|nr:c-type cytochrome [Salinarimonas ramus]
MRNATRFERRPALPGLATGVAILLASLLASPAARAADVEEGRAIAERWCASCHLVSREQETATDEVPTFHAIAARGDLSGETLTAFLADPHPVMPDMALTRDEIADLASYIDSLAD